MSYLYNFLNYINMTYNFLIKFVIWFATTLPTTILPNWITNGNIIHHLLFYLSEKLFTIKETATEAATLVKINGNIKKHLPFINKINYFYKTKTIRINLT